MDNKWIGKSLTIWGVVITFLMSAMPFVTQLFGWDVNPADLAALGETGTALINAVGTLIGLVMTIMGRLRAKTTISVT